MNKKTISTQLYLILMLSINSTWVHAENQSSDAKNIKESLEICASTTAQDENGKPNRKLMDQCMSQKGFSRPEGQGSHGHDPGSRDLGGRPPRPQNDQNLNDSDSAAQSSGGI